MKRRNFIQFGVTSLALSGCRTEYSPYLANVEKQNRNNKDIALIQNQSSGYPFSIALLSDTHRFYNDLKGVLDKINSDKNAYKFVIHGGDITDAGLQTEFDFYTGLRDKINLPFVHAIGNHDAITNGIFVFKNTFGHYDFTFQVEQTHFIFFNNNTWEFGENPIDLDWLESQLIAANNIIATQGGNIVVLGHIHHDSDERFSPEEIERYRSLMKTYPVSLSLNGHNHDHSIQNIDSMDYMTIGSVSNNNFMKLTFNSSTPSDYTLEQINV